MKRILTIAVGLFFATGILTSCVSNKRYTIAKMKLAEERKDNVALNGRINRLEDTVSYLHRNISDLNKRVGALGNANENAANELYKTNNELNMTKDQIAAQRARLHQLQAFIDQQEQATARLHKMIADALTGFNASELTVTMKDGRVYISMEEALLFPSGSAKVNPRGKEALSKVAGVLNTNPDINIDIEGHTDDKPIKTTAYPDNWALSTARATSIAHVLIDDYTVSPTRLIASGRSYYHPVASNATAEGRAKNRRTEIILEPKFDELMQLMDQNATTAK
jgi:chemotaxis protein MotB